MVLALLLAPFMRRSGPSGRRLWTHFCRPGHPAYAHDPGFPLLLWTGRITSRPVQRTPSYPCETGLTGTSNWPLTRLPPGSSAAGYSATVQVSVAAALLTWLPSASSYTALTLMLASWPAWYSPLARTSG